MTAADVAAAMGGTVEEKLQSARRQAFRQLMADDPANARMWDLALDRIDERAALGGVK